MGETIDGEASIENDEIIIRQSILGLVEYITDETLDDSDTVSDALRFCRRLLQKIDPNAFAQAFVDELNKGRAGDCSLIDTMIGDAVEALGSD